VAIAGAVVATGLGVWAFAWEPATLRVREHLVAVDGWPAGCDGLRIALLADFHTGSPWNGLDKLERIVARTAEARPDLVLLAGDFVIHGVPGGRFVAPEIVADRLGRLAPPLGVHAVLGNHDWWLDPARVGRAVEAAGIGLLEDRAVPLAGAGCDLWLAGISDFWEGPHDVGRALASIPDDGVVVAFTHNPDVFPEIPARVALTLAGHTHGGQVALPILGRPIVPSAYGERFAAGHVRETGRDLFVSTGLGTSILPVRFRVPPEISIVTVRAEAADPFVSE
jgi:predicted MPP superfamily phosphohydrolase